MSTPCELWLTKLNLYHRLIQLALMRITERPGKESLFANKAGRRGHSPRNGSQLELRPCTVPRGHTLQVRAQIRLTVQRLTSGRSSGKLLHVFCGFRFVGGKTHESDWRRDTREEWYRQYRLIVVRVITECGLQLDLWYANMKPPQKPRKPTSFIAGLIPPREFDGSIFSDVR